MTDIDAALERLQEDAEARKRQQQERKTEAGEKRKKQRKERGRRPPLEKPNRPEQPASPAQLYALNRARMLRVVHLDREGRADESINRGVADLAIKASMKALAAEADSGEKEGEQP